MWRVEERMLQVLSQLDSSFCIYVDIGQFGIGDGFCVRFLLIKIHR
jgi:hypothetical protein